MDEHVMGVVYSNGVEDYSLGLRDLTSRELLDEIVDRLQSSYQNANSPFHDTHLELQKAKDECYRRDSPEIFDLAFKKFQSL